MKDIKSGWWKITFNNKFYKIYYSYLKPNYSAYIDKVIKFAFLKRNDRILDLACGSGYHLVALKKKGFNNLSGLDYNYAKIAVRNTKPYNILIKKGDMLKEFGTQIYDFIMMASTSFGYFDDKNNQKVLKNCYQALRPGGKLFIDNLSAEFITKNFQPKSWTRFSRDAFLLEERELSKDKKYLSSFWYLLEKGKLYTLTNKLRLYSKEEFIKLFKKIDFKSVKIKELKAHNWFSAEK